MTGINLSDYQAGALDNQVLFDTDTETGLSDLSKALEARQITGRETTDLTTASGAPLKVEDLSGSLKLITFREQDITLFRDMPNSPASNTVVEFAQLVDYGVDRGGFTNEGELPDEEDSSYRRRAEFVKFLGVTKSITHQMQLVDTVIGPAVQREIKNGTLWILRKVDRALTIADSSIVPQEFNGLYTQHRNNDDFSSFASYMDSDFVIDLRGKHFTQKEQEDAALTIVEEGFGSASVTYLPPAAKSGFVQGFYEKQRVLLGGSEAAKFTAGSAPSTVTTSVGDIPLKHDLFMKKAKGRGFGADPKQPVKASLAVTSLSATVVTDADTKFGLASFQDATGAGDYLYGVAPINRYGEGPLTQVGNSAVTVSAAQSVDIAFTDGGGSNPATGYVIYRSKAGETGSNALLYPIFSVSKSQLASGYDGASAGSIRDRNRFLPNTDQGFTCQFDQEVLMWKQLAPLMKMDLARTSPAYRFMVLLYGTPQMFAPLKFIRFTNIGPWVPSS